MEQDVGAALDADQQRTLLTHEALDAGELGRTVGRSDHDHDGAGAHRRPERGQAEPVQQEVLLPTQELDAVAREAVELGHQARTRLLHLLPDQLGVNHAPGRDELVPDEQRAVQEAYVGAIAHPEEEIGAHGVHDGDTRVHEHLRTEVGEPAGDGLGCVDHPGDARLDQGFGLAARHHRLRVGQAC